MRQASSDVDTVPAQTGPLRVYQVTPVSSQSCEAARSKTVHDTGLTSRCMPSCNVDLSTLDVRSALTVTGLITSVEGKPSSSERC
jgi:hypothetical protein